MVTQAVTNPQHLLWLFPFLVLLSPTHPRMLPKMYALSILGLLYLLCLQSGFVFLYPLAQFTGLVSVEALNQGIEVFLIGTGGIRELVLSVLGGAGFLVLLTVPLPPRLDLMDRAISRIASRREGDEG
jgi:branched-subunit amino acid transport protein AzlD